MSIQFDPNGAADADSGIFGTRFTATEAKLHFLPVPWDVTTSYRDGTHLGPDAILRASHQMDLFHLDCGKIYEAGFFWHDPQPFALAQNSALRRAAQSILNKGGRNLDGKESAALEHINAAGQQLNFWVREWTKSCLLQKKIPVLIGGDHSTPQGQIEAIVEHYPEVGILHFDAHSDTRNAYEGFQYSHASIFFNVSQNPKAPKKITQVGIRDFCEDEYQYVTSRPQQFSVFYDRHMQSVVNTGTPWSQVAQTIVETLPQQVYISFDIDALDPTLCPNTGTPVPGGLQLAQVTSVLRQLRLSGREIVGFDLNEVSPGNSDSELDSWDANVGMRLLYELCAFQIWQPESSSGNL